MNRLISRKYSFRKLNIILLSVVIIFTLFISIGYSAINSNLLISGDLAAEYNEFSLYEQVRRDAYSNKFAKKYEGDTSTFEGDKGIYYYYGAASNNNVRFANYCWKIVRTTDTGGVKLLYNGVPAADGSCNNTGEASALTQEQMNTKSNGVAFNTDYSSPAYLGYMYNNVYERNVKSLSTTVSYKYGNGFKWDGTSYTLTSPVDSIGIPSDINIHHYTCFNSTGECNEINYIYQVSAGKPYYVVLSDGKSVE